MLDNQDIRRKGGIVKDLPITYTSFLWGSLSLKAFPFMTGFYSKDFLITLLLIPVNFTHTIAYLFTFLGAFFTALYSIRLLIITFYSKPNYPYSLFKTAKPYNGYFDLNKDSMFNKSLPLIILSFFAVIFGYLAQFMFLDRGLDFYLNSLFIHPTNNILLNGELSASSYLKLLHLLLLILFILFRIPGKLNNEKVIDSLPNNTNNISVLSARPRVNNNISSFSIFGFYDILLYYLYHTYFKFSLIIFRMFDRGLLEILGPYGLMRIVHYIGFIVELGSTGYLLHYAFLILAFLFLIIFLKLKPLKIITFSILICLYLIF